MVILDRIFHLLVFIGLIITFLGCAATQKDESAGQYLGDSVITTKVKAGIFSEATLKSLQINVKTHKAAVQLSGMVASAQSVSKAEEVAGRIEGVVSVKNDLIVIRAE
jgi:osmotically-inducible protein OsmY